MYEVSSVCAPEGPVSSGVEMKTLRKGQFTGTDQPLPHETLPRTLVVSLGGLCI